jgi:hypothetical protein
MVGPFHNFGLGKGLLKTGSEVSGCRGSLGRAELTCIVEVVDVQYLDLIDSCIDQFPFADTSARLTWKLLVCNGPTIQSSHSEGESIRGAVAT